MGKDINNSWVLILVLMDNQNTPNYEKIENWSRLNPCSNG